MTYPAAKSVDLPVNSHICHLIPVGRTGLSMLAPSYLHPFGWSLCMKRYAMFTSSGPAHKRGERAQRLVASRVLSDNENPFVNIPSLFPRGYAVHHQDFDKMNNCPLNFIILDPALHPSSTFNRDPYTGHFLSGAEYERRYR